MSPQDLKITLDPGEQIIQVINKFWMAMAASFVGAVIILVAIWFLAFNSTSLIGGWAIVGATVLTVLTAVGLGVAYYVYQQNHIVLTNMNIIQNAQLSLFSRRETTISLSEIRDVSFAKRGILQYIFDYGSLHVSVIDDENNYDQTFCKSPEKLADIIKQAAENFKNAKIRNPQVTQEAASTSSEATL